MTLPAVAAVEARISDIQSRFPAPVGVRGPSRAAALDFRAALTRASVPMHPNDWVQSRSDMGANAPSQGAGQLGAWVQGLPEAGRPWASHIEAAATEAGVDPRLLAALTWAESGFHAAARSGAGAIGLTQLMPGTAAGLGVDPADPVQNLRGGARYLRAQLDRFGSVELALAAYNAGPGRVAQAGGVPRIAETQAYVPRVLSYYARLGGVR
jgi:soluble lytic murein transglycosylase-like protein